MKNVLKSCSNESDECLAYQKQSYMFLKDSDKSNRNDGLETLSA